MKYNKIIHTIILFFILSCTCTIKAQESKLFEKYISCFTLKYFTETFQNCDTIGNKPYVPLKSDYLRFLNKEMQDTTMITWIVYKMENKHYLALLSQQIENTLSYYYCFVFYDEIGSIINSYKFLASMEDEYDTKLFMSKTKIKYLLYGPYVEKEKTNCKEMIYEIQNDGSLKHVSEQNYKVKRKNIVVW